ncbi:MAG TPA: ABC transporter substrate-binding protein, partial [Oculatellaceae cyanobacterium]
DRARKIAEAVVRQEEVLAVVGQYTSDSTLAAADVYQKNQLVFVSPTSTSEDLSNFGKSHHPSFFFRTVPSDRFTAQALAQYLRQQANQQNVAVFYNRRSRYSQSILNEFRSRFEASGGKIVDDSLATIPPGKAIDKAVKKGAKVLALFPNTQRGIWNQTLKLINANECKYPMIGGDTLYNPELLDGVGKKAAQCLVLAVPWHRMDSPNKDFPQAAEKLWAGSVSWRTALAYDATQVLIKALETPGQLSRTTVQQVLANPNFQANGATGTIRFLSNGDRNKNESKSTIKLVKLAVNKEGNLIFVPLDTIP